ncbi:DNA-binding MarR family transcriptional regulator [Sphingobium sp. OAS761]|uniref:MarR family winged helix-turn-helix transcriptional regulator n=1 Tax=Sphingobium sp. OAS761 TaxID=2817901 RepID=UPI00209EB461|nr:MarR family winged helix-turn-helix transcriptional regulator [Sphingobium sp. OAS761]MCP1470675.1 DNA-binding MarR family transcriptional regulator [Sphingobium sp. OAS761]
MRVTGETRQPISAIGPGQTLFEFVRHWSRRPNTPTDRLLEQNGRHVLVAEAVGTLTKREPVTINALAREIGIDQSGASRLVKEAAEAGYLEMKSSPHDARRREVSLKKAGQRLLVDAHCWQEEVFRQLTDGWEDDERLAFHRAMLRLLQRSHMIDT